MIRELRVLEAHGRHAQAVAFSADGQWLVSAGMDAAIRLWQLPGLTASAAFLGHLQSVNSLALSPDNQRLASCSSDGTTRVWSFPDGRPLHSLAGQRLPRWSPDGRLLTTLSGTGKLAHWDATTLAPLGEVSVADRRLFCFCYAPSDSELLVGGTGTIHRVRLHDGGPLGTLRGHGVAVASLAVSPDRAWLASTGAEGNLRLWDTGGWQPVRDVPLHAGGVLQLAWLPGSARVAVSCDKVIQVIPVLEAEPIQRLEVRIKGLYGLAASPDGRWLANAGADGRLRIWEFAA